MRHETRDIFYIQHSAFHIQHSALINRSSYGEVELAMVVARSAVDVVEAVAPIETQQAEHRQIDAYAETC